MLDNVFGIGARDGAARTGTLRLPHGDVSTPHLMPVGSQGTVKGILPGALRDLGVEMLLANSYHLLLRPGVELIERAGGLHRFMGWERPILTDSGGFQVFSLASLCKVAEDGVVFQSHIDGAMHFLGPEDAVRCQERLGSDVAMVLDHCPGYPCEEHAARDAVERTLGWAARCLDAHARADQALFAIVQGSVWPEMRAECARRLARLPFAGYAIGGVSVGEERPLRIQAVESSVPELPAGKPRYLMGVGEPEDILPAVAAGVDLFDCVIPTRCGRNGRVYTWGGRRNIRNARFRTLLEPLEKDCTCPTCRGFTAAYLHHLYTRDEMLGPILGTLHNLCFFQRLLGAVRTAIEERRFDAFRRDFLSEFTARADD